MKKICLFILLTVFINTNAQTIFLRVGSHDGYNGLTSATAVASFYRVGVLLDSINTANGTTAGVEVILDGSGGAYKRVNSKANAKDTISASGSSTKPLKFNGINNFIYNNTSDSTRFLYVSGNNIVFNGIKFIGYSKTTFNFLYVQVKNVETTNSPMRTVKWQNCIFQDRAIASDAGANYLPAFEFDHCIFINTYGIYLQRASTTRLSGCYLNILNCTYYGDKSLDYAVYTPSLALIVDKFDNCATQGMTAVFNASSGSVTEHLNNVWYDNTSIGGVTYTYNNTELQNTNPLFEDAINYNFNPAYNSPLIWKNAGALIRLAFKTGR